MDVIQSAAQRIDQSWTDIVETELAKPYMKNLRDFLEQEYSQGQTIFPLQEDIFQALRVTPLTEIKVVILGQDPYHGEGQAHGMAFSVRQGVRIPPSLRNIYKEITSSFSASMPPHGDLTPWAEQGVLLLNASLTVRQAAAGSHQKRGWETFTDALISAVSTKCEHVVFLLWGSHAQKKSALIDSRRHLILEAPHPSPLSAHRGFLGCGHFIKANEYLVSHGKKPVRWA